MKYFIIPYIALGFVLSCIIEIEYNCIGNEMFPIYYGNPFIFKQKSLISSMEFYYNFSGLILNILIWCLLLYSIHTFFQKLLDFLNNIWLSITYKSIIKILILILTFLIYVEIKTLGRGFDKELTYWYWGNLDQEAQTWGVKCNGKVKFFKK